MVGVFVVNIITTKFSYWEEPSLVILLKKVKDFEVKLYYVAL